MLTQLNEALALLHIALTDSQKKSLLDYLVLFAKWNAAYNLSAIKDPQQMLVKHLFDCLSVVKPIHAQLTHSLSTHGQNILDVGSGGGLPGLVLAICLPHVNVTMLDAVQKKMTFVRQVVAELGLANAQAHAVRIQDWQGEYPLITARAWTALADIPTLAGHCLAPGGSIAAMKGPRLGLESQTLPEGWRINSVQDLVVPQLHEARTLAFLVRS